MLEPLLTAEKVAKILSIDGSTVYAYAKSGKLKAVYFPHVRASKAVKNNRAFIRFRVEDVQQFVDNHYTGGLSSSNEEVKK